jgi:quercetin dioxygenase-like cupin family protein
MNLNDRWVPYAELQPCLNAFIDTRSPGSDKKENFTIIGPGVAENPDQHVHIAIPHGFNIGGARQPPGCLNSQHSHLTAEVFLVHSGTWAFRTGENADDGEIILRKGDVISIPTNVFRGFENIGDDSGFLFAVLGGDDPGHVLWAPSVFELASEHGLVLLEDGSLVDTALGQVVPGGKKPMSKTSSEQIASLDRYGSEALKDIVLPESDFQWSKDSSLAVFPGVTEASILGDDCPDESLLAGKLDGGGGFVFRALKLEPGAHIPAHTRAEEEVLFMQEGSLLVETSGAEANLQTGDTFTTPVGAERSFRNCGSQVCTAYVVRRGRHPAAPRFQQR